MQTTEHATVENMPAIYLPHGGGPWPFVEMGLDQAETAPLRAYLESIPESLPTTPKGIVVVSAHWEEPQPTLMTHPAPPMLYDYYGFPPASYELKWAAPGSPELGTRVADLLDSAGFGTARNADRGFDHGTFVPLKVMYPEPTVPTLQLSLLSDLDPARHLALGRALAPLRREGILIIGSGMSYHHLPNLMQGRGAQDAETFDRWLCEVMDAGSEQRAAALVDWEHAPAARAAHPREEHLLPLMVVTGAATGSVVRRAYSGTFARARISAFHFG